MKISFNALLPILILVMFPISLYAETPNFFGILPGVTSRAEIDLQLELVGVLPDEDAREYKPPVQATDVERVIASYFPDTGRLARLDVYLKRPLPAESMLSILGNRIISGRVRQDAGKEDLYYPSLKALIFFDDTPLVAAIGFLSPRYLADLQLDRFNELIDKKEAAEAKVAADMAVLIAPEYARGYLGQGLYFENTLQNPDEAMRYYRMAAEAPDGRSSRARALVFQGLLLWKKKDSQGAEERFREALQTWESGLYVRWDYGRFLWNSGRDQEAAVQLNRAFELHPEYAKTWYDWAKDYSARKENEQAARYFALLTRWLAAHPDNPYPLDNAFRLQAHRFHAYALHFLNRGDEGAAEYRRALALAPDDFFLNRGLSHLLLFKDRYDEALVHASKANQLRPDDSGTMVILARIHAAKNSKDTALQWLRAGVAAGFKEKGVLETDKYLAPLRELAEFKRLLNGM